MQRIINNINKFLKKTTYFDKLFFIFLIIIIVYFVFRQRSYEGFENDENSKERFIIKREHDIYDDFYSRVYDKLVFSDVKNNFEIGKIINNTHVTKNSRILDIGSGTGHHVAELNRLGYHTIGVDFSPAMIKKSKENYPEPTFIQGDANKTITFNNNDFSHIICLYFTIYYFKNKRQFFDNCYHWLKPGGFLIVHLVDREKFDTILPVGDVFTFVSPQKYADSRITSTVAKFDNYEYKSKFEFNKNNDNVDFIEIFKHKNTGKIRKNIHTLYMENQSAILSKARDSGFILVSKINMSKCLYNYQYLYILQKPS
jgi:SAM-dependent methyltransferase